MAWRSWWFDKGPRRRVKGGIKAASQRGSFGETWWAKRWVKTIEGYPIGARLSRGRSYARTGQVLSIDVGVGTVQAKVQGSQPQPYSVLIKVKPLGAAEWRKVADAVSSRAVFASKLLAGEMPQELEEVFQNAGVSLFPASYRDLSTDCSCPDWSNPCKHVAAVFYLLGEEFDRDPFLILKMRGMAREEFGAMLEGAKAAAAPGRELPPEPLPGQHSSFWRPLGEIPPDLAGEPPGELVEAALARRCGRFPFWRGQAPLLDFLDAASARASARARDRL